MRAHHLCLCDTLHSTRKYGRTVPCGLMAVSPHIDKTNQRLQTEIKQVTFTSRIQTTSPERSKLFTEHLNTVAPTQPQRTWIQPFPYESICKFSDAKTGHGCIVNAVVKGTPARLWVTPDSLVFPALPPCLPLLTFETTQHTAVTEREKQWACKRNRQAKWE